MMPAISINIFIYLQKFLSSTMGQTIQEHKLRLIQITEQTPEIKAFRFETPKPISYLPGQFFMARFEDDPKLQRAYSISSTPSNFSYIEITVKLVGVFTHKLFKAKINDYLLFKGPFGKIYFDETIKDNLVMISGGCGLSAFMGIIRYWNEKKLSNKISLIYSVKTPEDILFRKELEDIKSKNPNFSCIVTVTRSSPEHKWTGRTGRISEDLLKKNIKDIGNNLYYLCGPMEFVQTNMAFLENLGVKKERMKTDIWG
jgi:glycine betaine catabolism B